MHHIELERSLIYFKSSQNWIIKNSLIKKSFLIRLESAQFQLESSLIERIFQFN